MSLRAIFMGTPDFAVPTLMEVIGQGHEVVAVYSQPPRPGGRRGLEPRPSPVHAKAEAFGIPVHNPTSLKSDEAIATFAGHEADVTIVVAYGMILPFAVLAAPRLGCLNLHASLLPRWRGAAPIQRAIMAGDRETGVNVMRMEEGLDTGPVCLSEATPIGADETAGALHDRLAVLGADLMVRALAALERDALTCSPQPEDGVTYADKIDKAEARIDWSAPAEIVHNRIRGLSPFPGAWCEAEIGGRKERIKLLHSALAEGAGAPGAIVGDDLTIACGDGAVRLVEVQRAGKQAVDGTAFLRGLQQPLESLA
jgi:methionyl-tRNA formyltransferase